MHKSIYCIYCIYMHSPLCWCMNSWNIWIHIWKTYEFIAHMWIHIWIHIWEFIYIWIHKSWYQFIHEMIIWMHIHVNSYVRWIYEFMSIWIHGYELADFLYEFISIWNQVSEFIVSNLNSWTYDCTMFFMILKSYLNSYYVFIQDFMIMNSYVTFHDLWIHIWIHVYEEYDSEEYREIIPEIMCTKVPDD